MARTRTTLSICGLVLVMAVLTGCSGDDDDEARSTTSAPAAGPTTTLRPVDTSFSGQDSEQFCAQARTYNERFSKVGANPTPQELRTITREGQTAINEALRSAPAEIKKDVEVLAGAFTTLLAELEKVNYESNRLPPTALAGLQTPEFQTSSTRFQAYIRNVCRAG